MGLGISAAATSSTLSTSSSEEMSASQATSSIDQPLEKFGVVFAERPRLLQAPRPLHISLPGDQAILSVNTLLSSSKAIFTPTVATSLASSDSSFYLLGSTRGSLTASRSRSASALAPTDGLRVVQPSDASSGRVLASGRNQSSNLTLSPPSPTANITPPNSAIRTTRSDSAIGGIDYASASHKSITAASGTGESPRLAQFLNPIENGTESRPNLHSWLRPRPTSVRPVHLLLSNSRIGLYATPGALIQKSPLAMATGSNRISSPTINLLPLGTGESSMLRSDLESMKNRTESRKSERLKAHVPSSTFNQTGHYLGAVTGGQYPTNCSGLVTSTADVVYELVTSTILVNETIILGPNATTPLPVFITPPPACQTITAPCKGADCLSSTSSSTMPVHNPKIGPEPKRPLPKNPIVFSPATPTTTSTLLVTKKTPAIVQQQSAVEHLFGPSTPTPQAVAAQANSNGQQAAGQDSGSSNTDMSTQSDDSSPSNSDSGSQSTVDSTPQQVSSNEGATEPGAGDSADSHGTQYVSTVAMAGNVPISIASNAVIVGSHTVKAGSPPTTLVANGQTLVIQPSQIVAQGKTIPIRAAVTPLPANSATIGNIPVVLRPQDVAIGSQTFEHGSTPTSVVYNGQTYSWDATHLVGAGATVAFPLSDSSAPRVTAGGQVFSVFPSQLKASGRNIPLPHTAKASPFVYNGQTFLVNPSQIIAPDTSITLPPVNKVTPFVYIDHSLSVDASQFMARSTTIPLSSGYGTVTYNGQVLTIKPSEIIGPSTTIALSAPDDSAVLPTAVTTGGLTFLIGPSAAVVGSSTYTFVPGKGPATIMTHGEAVLVGSNGVQFGNIHVPIPTGTPSFSAITQGDLTFSVAPSEVVVDGHTDIIRSDMAPITTIVDGHTISIGPKGVGLASTTIPLPTPKPSFSMATEGGLTFSVAPSEVVVRGKTYFIASNKVPITTAIDGQMITIGPKGIHLEGTTVNFPVIQTPTCVTVGGLTFSVGATDAVISGTTYAIGSGAPLQTVVMGSQTVEIGSAGIMLPSTTIAPEQTPTAVIADGLTFFVDSTEAVINGTTYAIGSGAAAKTIVDGSATIILGTDGVALPSTTIRPWSSAAQTGFSSVLGTSGASSAATVTGPLIPIVTGKEGDKQHATGVSTIVSGCSTLLGLVLGVLTTGLTLI